MGARDIIAGAFAGIAGDPMAVFKMQQARQKLQMKFDEMQRDKEQKDLMAQQTKIHIKVLEHQLKHGIEQEEEGKKPLAVPQMEDQVVPSLGQSPMEGEQGASGGIVPKIIQQLTRKELPISGAEGERLHKAGLKLEDFIPGLKKKEEYTLAPGAKRFQGGKQIAENPKEEGSKKPLSDIGKVAYDLGITDLSSIDQKGIEKLSKIHSMWAGKENLIKGSETDKNGRVTAFAIDVNSGNKTTFDLGVIGKPKEQGLSAAAKKTDERFVTSQTAGLRKEFEGLQTIKNYREFEMQYAAMKEGFSEAKRTNNYIAADQDIIMTFNKMMDLKGTVRIEEYNRTPQDLSWVNRIQGKVSKIAKGGPGLTDDDRQAIMRMGNRFNKVYTKIYNQEAKRYRSLGEMQKFDPNLIAQEKVIPDVSNRARQLIDSGMPDEQILGTLRKEFTPDELDEFARKKK